MTSLLDAVNTMIACVGETPVNSLDGALSADAAVALNTLRETVREVQSRGWHFNTQRMDLVPDSQKRIKVPVNVVRADLDGASDDPHLDIALRGDVLYDRGNSTEQFDRPVKGVKVVVLLEWDRLPESCRRYCMIRAARKFADRMVGSEKSHSFNLRDEAMAWADLREYELDTADMTIFDDWSVYRVLHRVR
jgi:hypothetical protein